MEVYPNILKSSRQSVGLVLPVAWGFPVPTLGRQFHKPKLCATCAYTMYSITRTTGCYVRCVPLPVGAHACIMCHVESSHYTDLVNDTELGGPPTNSNRGQRLASSSGKVQASREL